jgi:hypothetical protein
MSLVERSAAMNRSPLVLKLVTGLIIDVRLALEVIAFKASHINQHIWRSRLACSGEMV